MRVTSFTNAVTVCSLAVPMFYDPVLYNDKLFGYTHYAGDVIAIILDFWFIVHGISAFTVFFLGYKPFLFYYGAVFVMYELSTPFLNIHWMCDKLGLTGSTLQLVNGIVLLFVFFGARIVFGLYASFDLFYELYSKADIIPVERAVVLFVLNSILNALNLFWFYKMIDSVRRRFAPSSTKVDGKASGQRDQRRSSEWKEHDDNGIFLIYLRHTLIFMVSRRLKQRN
ncbi:TLC domain-containing protein [Obelidium mucronatum]|nr:TLC domain-containing protein [Obelidium mucronatum]